IFSHGFSPEFRDDVTIVTVVTVVTVRESKTEYDRNRTDKKCRRRCGIFIADFHCAAGSLRVTSSRQSRQSRSSHCRAKHPGRKFVLAVTHGLALALFAGSSPED